MSVLGLKCQFWNLKRRFFEVTKDEYEQKRSKFPGHTLPKCALNNSIVFVDSVVPFCIVVISIVVVSFMWAFAFALPLCFVVVYHSYVWVGFVIATAHGWQPTTNICPIETSRKFSKLLTVFNPHPPLTTSRCHGLYTDSWCLSKQNSANQNLSHNILKNGCQIILKMNVLRRNMIAKYCQPNVATYRFESKHLCQSCSGKTGSVPTI